MVVCVCVNITVITYTYKEARDITEMNAFDRVTLEMTEWLIIGLHSSV